MRLLAGLHPDPLGELSARPGSLAALREGKGRRRRPRSLKEG